MKRQRIICFLLLLCLVLTCAPVCYAADEAVFCGDAISLGCGKTADFTVSIQSNPGLAAFQLNISFDKTALMLEPDPENAAVPYCVGDVFPSETLICAETDSGCRVIWYGGENRSVGTAFTLRLTAKDDAAPATYSISITPSTRNCVDQSENLVPCRAENGAVEVHEMSPTMFAGEAEAFPGEDVVVDIGVRDNPGFSSFQISLRYDASSLEPVVDEYVDPVVSYENGFSCADASALSNGTIRLIGVGTNDWTNDGVFAKLRFHVKETVIPKAHRLELSCIEQGTVDQTGERVSFASEAGTVTVFAPITAERIPQQDGSVCVKLTNVGKQEQSVSVIYASYAESGKMQELLVQPVSGLMPEEIRTVTLEPKRDCASYQILTIHPTFSYWLVS